MEHSLGSPCLGTPHLKSGTSQPKRNLIPSLRLLLHWSRFYLLPPLRNNSQILLRTRKMDVFFANPEPSFSVGDRQETHRTVPIHHAHCIGPAEGCFFISGQSRPGANLENRESHLRHRQGRNTKRKRLRPTYVATMTILPLLQSKTRNLQLVMSAARNRSMMSSKRGA